MCKDVKRSRLARLRRAKRVQAIRERIEMEEFLDAIRTVKPGAL